MDTQEKAYIDKKFAELENKLLNPDPKELWERSKKYRSISYSYSLKAGAIALVVVGLTMAITFRVLGLF